MRRINFGNREKYIAEVEGPKPQKRINWDRVVYLFIFFGLVLSLAYYFLGRYVYVNIRGNVAKGNYIVFLPNDSWIRDVKIQEKEDVEIGDTLFVFRREIDDSDNSLFNSIQSASASSQRAILDARKNILVNEERIRQNLELISLYQSKIEQLELMVILDANSAIRIDEYKLEIAKLESQIEVWKEEIRFWRNYIAQAPKVTEDYQTILSQRLSNINPLQAFLSPVNGRIDRINYRVNQLVYKGQPVLDILQEEAYILGYIPEDEFGTILEGDIIKVKFPDKFESEGIVDKIYANQENLPPQYQRNNITPTEYYLAIIHPVNPDDETKWVENYNNSVKLSKSRIF